MSDRSIFTSNKLAGGYSARWVLGGGEIGGAGEFRGGGLDGSDSSCDVLAAGEGGGLGDQLAIFGPIGAFVAAFLSHGAQERRIPAVRRLIANLATGSGMCPAGDPLDAARARSTASPRAADRRAAGEPGGASPLSTGRHPPMPVAQVGPKICETGLRPRPLGLDRPGVRSGAKIPRLGTGSGVRAGVSRANSRCEARNPAEKLGAGAAGRGLRGDRHGLLDGVGRGQSCAGRG